MARFNTALNRTQVDLRQGSLFDPVASDSFDLIVSNPPFVIGSPDAAHHTYRDSGLPGDTVCARLVADAREHLADGGWCQLLANWEITDGDDWAAHPRSWVESTGLDAWVIERDVQDPAAYVETWLRDAGEQHGDRYPDLYDAWLTGLQDRGVTGVGFGLITLRRGGRTTPIRRFQHVPQPWVQPVAPDVQQWFAVRDLLAEDPSALLRRKLSVSRDVALETYRTLTGDGEPVAMLHRTSGMAWTAPIDEFGIEVLARLNGEREAADVVVALAQQWDVDVASALGGAVGVLSQMAEEGFVHW
jgi:methylase of polypeptide subunit release factors